MPATAAVNTVSLTNVVGMTEPSNTISLVGIKGPPLAVICSDGVPARVLLGVMELNVAAKTVPAKLFSRLLSFSMTKDKDCGVN